MAPSKDKKFESQTTQTGATWGLRSSSRMSLTIYVAHSGARLSADPRKFPSYALLLKVKRPHVDELLRIEYLQSWISQKVSIDVTRQILMTARGKQVKLQTLLQENEIFLYDRRVLSPASDDSLSSLIPTTPVPAPSVPRKPPQDYSEVKSFQTWQNLFKERRAWATEISDTAGRLVDRIILYDGEAVVIQRSAAIAVENVKQHVGSLRPKYEESKAWAENVLEDQAFLLGKWEPHMEKLALVPAIPEIGRCLYRGQDAVKRPSADSLSTLYDYATAAQPQKASNVANQISRAFAERVEDLTKTFEDVAHDAFDVVEGFGQSVALSDSDLADMAGRLNEEIEVVARKVNGDYEHILSLANTQKSMTDMSRTAPLHTRNFLPALQQTLGELDQLLRHAIERKNNVIASTVRHLQRVSVLESTIAQVHTQLANLDIEEDEGRALDVLSDTIKLPMTYGSLLVECIRRREWTEKITADSSSLVEEMAVFKEEEVKRRKKWVKDMGNAVDLSSIDDMALGIDINLQAQKQKWPNVSRQDVGALVKAVKNVPGFEDIAQKIQELMTSLDAPTKQQARRAKAFRNGSIHETSFGKQSLLLRRDDEIIQSLQSDKTNLEDRLKGSESRIRKLEDLLHRQTQTSRSTSSHAYTANDAQGILRHTSSPITNFATAKAQDAPSRRSSVSSRKVPNESEEKALAQRVLDLEGELNSIKQQAAAKAKAETEIMSQMQEAVSTKEDLLNNMEAQQREFDDERRLIEDENSKLKMKLEEFEDEMDRMLESREQDNRAAVLEEKIIKLRQDAASEAQTAQEHAKQFQTSHTAQVHKIKTLESQVQDLDEEVAGLSTRLQKRESSAATNHRALRTVMFRLSKDSVAPEDLDSLVETIEELAKQSAVQAVEVGRTLENVRADNAAQETRITTQTDEINGLRKELCSTEKEVFSLREELAQRKTELATLHSKLATERSEHNQLRSRFADGETSSESLRASLAEREDRIINLNGQLAGLQEDMQQLQGENVHSQEQHKMAQQALEARLLDQRANHEAVQQDLKAQVNSRLKRVNELQRLHNALDDAFQARARCAEDVSTRLYTLKNTLGHLLEQVGFTISKQDDTITFQRTARATTASSILNEPSSSMVRSLQAPLPTKSAFEETYDSRLPHWTSLNEPDKEIQQFTTFIKDINSFDTDAFSEAIIKRIKDAEHTARKYFKDARAYRDKYRRVQTEAHEKITVRGFKEGDLALFLPTRNHATKPWAAFNVGSPHYFLREQEVHRLHGKDWILARINKVEPRVVDLSKSLNALKPTADGASDVAVSFDDDNPFELSDGLRWNLVDATEEKTGPPLTIASSKTTVAAANVDVRGSIRIKQAKDGNDATITLTRSLDSRRSSSNSKAGVTSTSAPRPTTARSLDERLEGQNPLGQKPNGGQAQALQPTPVAQLPQGHTASTEVCTDLLFGP